MMNRTRDRTKWWDLSRYYHRAEVRDSGGLPSVATASVINDNVTDR